MPRDPSASLYQPQTVACDLCGSDAYDVLYGNTVVRDLAASDFTVYGELYEHPRIVRCRHCSLVYANPRDDVAGLQDKYHAMPVDGYLEEHDGREAAFRAGLRLIRRYVPSGTVLDIGCSAGPFLRGLPAGYEPYGLEPSAQAAGIARQHFGDRIRVGGIQEAGFAAGSFHLITLWDVIEHLESPREALQTIHRWMRPGGYLVVLTPDVGSFTARLMGTRWHHLIRQHLFYFTSASLSRLLDHTGYRVVRRAPWVRQHSIGYLLKRSHLWKVASADGSLARIPPPVQSLLGIRVPVTLFDDLFVIAQAIS